MIAQYTSHVSFFFFDKQIFAVLGDKPDCRVPITELHIPLILELFTHCHTIDEAYLAYREARRQSVLTNLYSFEMKCPAWPDKSNNILLLVANRVIVCRPASFFTALNAVSRDLRSNTFGVEKPGDKGQYFDLTDLSTSAPCVATALIARHNFPIRDYPDLSSEEFTELVGRLYSYSFLTVPRGAVNLGDLNRPNPFCMYYGITRGTPIDRYYLDKFVMEIRGEVTGHALEIGGKTENQYLYGFNKVESYSTLDLQPFPGISIVGDAHNSEVVGCNSLDTVILFNVLEHCENPSIVLENIYNWLKNYGKVFCMVPNAQRVHDGPKDYWRLLPDAIDVLFPHFLIRQRFIFGNLISTIANLAGIASEELAQPELDILDERYPVATCVYAQKIDR